MRLCFYSLPCVALLLLAGPAPSALAQSQSPSLHVERLAVKAGYGTVFPRRSTGVVMAKFVCGTSRSGEEVAPGKYFTAVNIANAAGEGAEPLVLLMHVILTNGTPRVEGPSPLATIPGLSGIEIDCEEIALRLKADLNATLIKGFVRLSANPATSAPLTEGNFEGVAVYTTAPVPVQ